MAASLRLSATLALALCVRTSDPRTHEWQRLAHTPSLSEPRARTGPPNTSPHAHTQKAHQKGGNPQAATTAARTRPSTHPQARLDHTRATPQRPPAYGVGSGDNPSAKQRHEGAMIFCHSAAGSGESCHDRFLTFRFDETFGISLDNGPMRITGSSMTTIAPITNCTEGVDKHAISAEQHTAASALCSLCICSMMALIASSYPDEKTRAACRKRKHENRAQLALSWTPPPPTLTDPQGMPTPGLNGAPNARSLSTRKTATLRKSADTAAYAFPRFHRSSPPVSRPRLL